MIPASKYFSTGETQSVELTDDEKEIVKEMRVRIFPRGDIATPAVVVVVGMRWPEIVLVTEYLEEHSQQRRSH